MTHEPEQPSLFEDTLWNEAFGDLAHAQPDPLVLAEPTGPTPEEPTADASPEGSHPDQPSLYEPTQPDLGVPPVRPDEAPAQAAEGWSRTGTPGRAAPTSPRSVLTNHLEPTQEMPRTPDNVVPLRRSAPAIEPSPAGTGTAEPAPTLTAPGDPEHETGEPSPQFRERVRWAAVVMFLGEMAWLALIAMIGWRLGSGWPVGAATAAVMLATFTAVWATWLAPRASRRLVAEDRNVVLMLIGSIITILGAWVGLLAPAIAASLIVVTAHALDHRLAVRRASRQASGD